LSAGPVAIASLDRPASHCHPLRGCRRSAGRPRLAERGRLAAARQTPMPCSKPKASQWIARGRRHPLPPTRPSSSPAPDGHVIAFAHPTLRLGLTPPHPLRHYPSESQHARPGDTPPRDPAVASDQSGEDRRPMARKRAASPQQTPSTTTSAASVGFECKLWAGADNLRAHIDGQAEPPHFLGTCEEFKGNGAAGFPS
jgi:hypothetical protein